MHDTNTLKQEIISTCRFCNPPDKERILYETDNFYVMVSLGPIVEGYLLLVSKKHIGACLNLPKELIDEFLEVKELIREKLTKEYGSCIFFEHGRSGSSLTYINKHKHCYHAHLHCVPCELKLNTIIKDELPYKTFNSFKAAWLEYNEKQQYLYVEDYETNVFDINKKIRRQYLRYEFAKAINKIDLWDWVENQNWDIIYSTINRLEKYFHE